MLGNDTYSLNDISQAAEDLKVVQESLPKVLAQFQSQDLGPIDIQEIVDSFFGQTDAQTSPSMDAMSDMICGKGKPISVFSSVVFNKRRRRSVGRSRSRREEELEEVEGSSK